MVTRRINFEDDVERMEEMAALAEIAAAEDREGMGAAELGADYYGGRDALTPAFVTAGKAIFTVSNPQGVRYTFRVKLPKEPRGEFFASVLFGSNNETDYVYVGMVDGRTGALRTTRGSKVAASDTRTKVLAFALRVIYGRQALPAGYRIEHAGKCCRCGRTLTVPASIRSGIGPECAQMREAA